MRQTSGDDLIDALAAAYIDTSPGLEVFDLGPDGRLVRVQPKHEAPEDTSDAPMADDVPAPRGCLVFLLGCGGAVLGLLELVRWLA